VVDINEIEITDTVDKRMFTDFCADFKACTKAAYPEQYAKYAFYDYSQVVP
jgi:hypothetical protein